MIRVIQVIEAAGDNVAVAVYPAHAGVALGTVLPAPQGVLAIKGTGVIINADYIYPAQENLRLQDTPPPFYSSSLCRYGSASHSLHNISCQSGSSIWKAGSTMEL
ncbi:hypothetical protein MOTHE_c04050 [Moorella thermoacetica]|nr:hypothetical protein MOTHE_c04050 [Moorella thermoacetica]AKX95860.1 hypothetical protein MOTHA_c04940 [Moorella thermoacetica]OIQ55947.1 hypothetical protein MOCA_16410 [Moorella thermoacetica]OIQ60756.1 hypothetical protein MTIN_16920 [Moorella thermoacetica]QCZ99674.1 hypothetical protein MothHH_00507 [Moorella thermoacetica]